MVLDFVQTEKGSWEAHFVATSNFNLHVESDEDWFMTLSQRGSAEGAFCPVFNKNSYEAGRVFDCDFGALVYPKHIEVEFDKKPKLVEVTQEDET